MEAGPTRQDLGRLGERMAALFLESCGFICRATRERTRDGEIDLIAARGGLVVFVEVKTRRGDRCGSPQAAVTPAKLARLRRLAASYLARAEGPAFEEFRFDVVAITIAGEGWGCRLEHFAGVGRD